MVREVETGPNGLAQRALYIDKRTQQWHYAYADAFMLAASACESARILLNSRGSAERTALGNRSGLLGHNLRDSVGVRMLARFEELERMTSHNCDGIGIPHVMIPWWRPPGGPGDRGYEIFFSGGLMAPGVGMFDHVADEVEGYGAKLQTTCSRRYGSYVEFFVNGGMTANDNGYCELDPDSYDQWGIPTLRFSFRWSDEDRKLARHALETCKSIIESAGGQFVQLYFDWQGGIVSPGGNFRESGTAIMGNDPEMSVVNPHCQTHEVRNLFVIDGAVFPTTPEKGPTLTIMAMAWCAAEYLVALARRGECVA
jgi:choline dehydrogenase-like flavoprotein